MKRSFITKLIMACIFCVGMLGSLSLPAKAYSDKENDLYTEIDDYIESEMRYAHIPGLVLGIVKGDQIAYLSSYGSSNESGQSITPQTPFILGSTSKAITSTAIMQLVEAGKVDLDAPIGRYLTDLHINGNNGASSITVRFLLNQTSGIPKSADWKNPSQVRNDPGKVFEYSNANYELLGKIVESVTGQPYGEYIKQHIFSPLDMTHSFISQTEAKKDGLATGYRTWFGFNRPSEMPYPEDAIPAGYIISSAEDMSRFLIFQMNGGRYHNNKLISEMNMAEMHKPATVAPMFGEGSYYGMGWFIKQMDGISMIKVPGEVPNYHSTLTIMPSENYGLILMANVNNSIITSGNIEKITDGVASILVGKEPNTIGNTAYLQTYLVLDVVCLIIFLLIFVHVFNVKRWYVKLKEGKLSFFKRFIIPVILNLAIPLTVLILFPKSVGLPWFFIIDFAPDLSIVLLTVSIILLLIGCFKLAFILYGLKKKRSFVV